MVQYIKKRPSVPASKISKSSDFSDDITSLLGTISTENGPEREGRDRRKHHRHPVHWRVAIVNKNSVKNDIYHGRTHNVSISGVSILADHNIFFTTEVVILLAIPPIHQGLKETILEIQCSPTHTVLDSVCGQFRLGMQFTHFKEGGKRILSDVLSKRHIPKQGASQNVKN